MPKINLLKVDTISLRYSPRIKPSQRPMVTCSKESFQILRDNWSKDLHLCEEFNILLLDNQSHVLGICNLSKGGITSTVVDIRLVFATALSANACALILSHNHPSGCNQPSQNDIQLTKRFKQAGHLLDIKIHDHLILSSEDTYFSFADNDLYL